MPGRWPDPEPPVSWWVILAGSLAFAAATLAMIWSFAILAWALGVAA